MVMLGACGGTSPHGAAAGACNGHRELCDLSLPEVTLAATHNSMSAPLPGWRSVQQDAPIDQQLRDGIRGLLIDTHYGWASGSRVRTDFTSRRERRASERNDGVSPGAARAAEQIRARLRPGPMEDRQIYLCHGFCELGATPLAPILRELREFLTSHPREVLVVINEDYVDSPAFVSAAREAGLERFAFTPPADGRWPTLGNMIDSGRRLVLLAENEAGSAPWYRSAFERAVQDTPYSFRAASRLIRRTRLEESCRLNRGAASAPLFMMNHWVTTDPKPLPVNASLINGYGLLLRRGRRCGALRRHVPNLLAVDFYRRGAVFRVANTLNSVH
jgi:hypothetical protein